MYVGVTHNLSRRIFEHKQKLIQGFTKKYSLDQFVYAEEFNDIYEAIAREKCIKGWNRKWKFNLIESVNPEWVDLYETLL